MQINGTAANDFDSIDIQGSVQLGGTLDVLINPVSCTGNDPCGVNANGTWTPVLGESLEIIKLVLAPVVGDYDANGTVGNEDYDVWRSNFGNATTIGAGADGNKNGVIDGADFVLWRNNFGATSALGSFNNTTFGSINIVDPAGTLAANGVTRHRFMVPRPCSSRSSRSDPAQDWPRRARTFDDRLTGLIRPVGPLWPTGPQLKPNSSVRCQSKVTTVQ